MMLTKTHLLERRARLYVMFNMPPETLKRTTIQLFRYQATAGSGVHSYSLKMAPTTMADGTFALICDGVTIKQTKFMWNLKKIRIGERFVDIMEPTLQQVLEFLMWDDHPNSTCTHCTKAGATRHGPRGANCPDNRNGERKTCGSCGAKGKHDFWECPLPKAEMACANCGNEANPGGNHNAFSVHCPVVCRLRKIKDDESFNLPEELRVAGNFVPRDDATKIRDRKAHDKQFGIKRTEVYYKRMQRGGGSSRRGRRGRGRGRGRGY
jgi:hypothetical protein